MQRKKEILLVSHCILNQNTVIEGAAKLNNFPVRNRNWQLVIGPYSDALDRKIPLNLFGNLKKRW